jgi:glycosyltransferase involved in cell wall biosynthesis
MIRIAHCIHGLGLGGAQKVIAAIAQTGDSSRFAHHVYSTEGGELRDDVARAGASVRILPRHIPKYDPFWVRRLARAMAQDRVQLVHTHLFGDSLHGYLAERRSGSLPTVMTMHNELSSFTGIQRIGYRYLLARCDRTVACSENVRQSIEEAGDEVRSLHCIPNGIEEPPEQDREANRKQLLAEFGLDDDTLVLASIGRLSEQKGLTFLIDAFARVPAEQRDRSVLLLVGEGELRKELEQAALRHGVGDRVLFTGFRSDIRELLSAIDILVFSSLWEGLPIALLEAMAAGVCIVGTRIPGIAQAVEDGHHAVLVPPADAAELSAALAHVGTDEARRRTLGRAARERFRERFTATPMVRDYEALYSELIDRID